MSASSASEPTVTAAPSLRSLLRCRSTARVELGDHAASTLPVARSCAATHNKRTRMRRRLVRSHTLRWRWPLRPAACAGDADAAGLYAAQAGSTRCAEQRRRRLLASGAEHAWE
jgi:hypothetical protein